MSTNVATLTGAGFTEADALAWLKAADQVSTSSTELARTWQWTTSKVKRCLDRWSKAGWIERRIAANRSGTLIIYRGSDQGGAAKVVAEQRSAPPAPKDRNLYRMFKGVRPRRADKVDRAVRTTDAGPATPARTTDGEPPAQIAPRRSWMSRSVAFLIGATLAGIGVALGYVSMRINQGFGAQMASSPQAAELWQLGSLLADLFKMVALVGASYLWAEGRRWFAGLLAVAWAITLIYAVMAAAGFTSTNIADSTARRGSVADQRERLKADIDRLRTELGWNAAIEEAQRRSAAVIAVALQEAQPKVPLYVWKTTNGCTDVTIEPSRLACRQILDLRAEHDKAQRREQAEADLRDKERQLSGLPPVVSADPQAQSISQAVEWLSFGFASFGERDVQLTRFLLILLVIELPGAIGLSAGIEIWRRAVF